MSITWYTHPQEALGRHGSEQEALLEALAELAGQRESFKLAVCVAEEGERWALATALCYELVAYPDTKQTVERQLEQALAGKPPAGSPIVTSD